ncbi:MAG: radical SAM protein [Candidatus Omnitrophica bacterium]|nr:radical SAM protein [Candidatus Omnitrophota bacterium]
MKVLLINPQSKAIEKSCIWQREMLTPVIPLGLAYIAAVLEKNTIPVKVFDQVAEKWNEDKLFASIVSEKPDLVGITCLSASMDTVISLSRRIKNYNKDIKIILGNIHASIFAKQLLNAGIADIIVHGEGEYTMLEVVSRIERKLNFSGIGGIGYIEEGKLYNNRENYIIPDLDNLPYPAFHLFDLNKYKEIPLASIYGEIALVISASRGCPFDCIFCAQNKIFAKTRYRKIENVIDEMEYMHTIYNAKYFGFVDAFFPFSIEHGMEFCEQLIKRGLNKKVRWVTETVVNLIDPQLTKKMKEAGLHMLEFGFESGSQRVLDTFGKKINLEQGKKAVRYAKDAGILTLGLFMLGLPGETAEECEQTVKFAKELDCDFVKFNLATPYPGSRLYELSMEKIGKIRNLSGFNSWYDWFENKDNEFYTVGLMSVKELRNIQRKAMFSFYFRPVKVIKTIVNKRVSFKFLLFGAMLLLTGYFKALSGKWEKPKIN